MDEMDEMKKVMLMRQNATLWALGMVFARFLVDVYLYLYRC